MKDNSKSGRIKLLPDSVALRIAAGEVIDRPFSVIRELIDNSIDAGADKIDVYVKNGGIDNIRVVDNGRGMSREDLEICCLPYSTSKINTLEDLDKLNTLGFRGEALSSISACSKLEINSKTREGSAYKLLLPKTSNDPVTETWGQEGTLIDVSNLFYSIPARKKFLKRPSAEATACRKIFVEKSLPFPDITFRFFSDNVMKSFLPVSTLKERILAAFPDLFNKQLIHEFSTEHKDFTIQIIVGDPSLKRKDRRYIQVYLNNRRISEFALVQAVEYGFSEFLPGGNYPVAFIFIKIDPSLIDFNIHPAKKEVRFQNLTEIHKSIVNSIKSFLSDFRYNYSTSIQNADPKLTQLNEFKNIAAEMGNKYTEGFRPSNTNYSNFKVSDRTFPVDLIQKSKAVDSNVSELPESRNIHYMGQIFNLFLLAEVEDKFYFIDQHAAHEKIIFNELKSKYNKIQELLVPAIFEIEGNRENSFVTDLEKYSKTGVSFEDLGAGRWQLISVPENCIGNESIIIDFVKKQKGTISDLETELYADMACKSAIKDGDVLDKITAVQLVKKTFKLENARCPHGRPVWFQVSREELFRFVGRL